MCGLKDRRSTPAHSRAGKVLHEGGAGRQARRQCPSPMLQRFGVPFNVQKDHWAKGSMANYTLLEAPTPTKSASFNHIFQILTPPAARKFAPVTTFRRQELLQEGDYLSDVVGCGDFS